MANDDIILVGDLALIRDDFKGHLNLSIDLKRKFEITPVVANLEAACLDIDLGEEDVLQFCMHHESLKSLSFIKAVSLANNHVFDFGKSGFEETKRWLDEYNICFFGTRHKPVFTCNGYKILGLATYSNFPVDGSGDAILTVQDDQFWIDLPTFLPCDSKTVNIVYFHTGNIFSGYLNRDHLDLIDRIFNEPNARVDYLVTSHSHCVGGFLGNTNERVFVSLGDFFLDGLAKRRHKSVGLYFSDGKSPSPFFMKRVEDTVTSDLRVLRLLGGFRVRAYRLATLLIARLGRPVHFVLNLFEYMSHFASTGLALVRKYGFKQSFKLVSRRRYEVFNSLKWLTPASLDKFSDEGALPKDRKLVKRKDL